MYQKILHAVIFFACCFTLVCRNKSPTGLMLHVCEYSTKNKISMSMSMCRLHFTIKFSIGDNVNDLSPNSKKLPDIPHFKSSS